MREGVLVLIISMFSVFLFGQNTDRFGTRLKLDAEISNISPWNFKIGLESRIIFRELQHGTEDWLGYRYERTSLTFFGGRSFNNFGSLGAGYMIRQLGPNWVHRGIQQYATKWNSGSWQLGFRLRMDETFAENKDATYRLRYRIGGDRPLKGKELQAEQWFFTWSHEQMPVLQGGEFIYELRVVLELGYQFKDNSKFKTGLEGRWSDIGLDRMEYQLWWRCDYSFSI